MKPMLTACERCGLREVRHELERKGIVIRFCDECYWREISEPEAAGPTAGTSAAPAADQPARPNGKWGG